MCIQKLWWKVLLAGFLVVLFATACKEEDSEGGSSAVVTQPQMGKAFVEQTSLNTAKVTWQAATDDSTPHEQMGYEVHFSETMNFTPSEATRRTTVFGVTEAEMTGYVVPNEEGTLWTVFEMDQNGAITPINAMGYEVNQGGISTPDFSAKSTRSSQAVVTDYHEIVFQSKKE